MSSSIINALTAAPAPSPSSSVFSSSNDSSNSFDSHLQDAQRQQQADNDAQQQQQQAAANRTQQQHQAAQQNAAGSASSSSASSTTASATASTTSSSDETDGSSDVLDLIDRSNNQAAANAAQTGKDKNSAQTALDPTAAAAAQAALQAAQAVAVAPQAAAPAAASAAAAQPQISASVGQATGAVSNQALTALKQAAQASNQKNAAAASQAQANAADDDSSDDDDSSMLGNFANTLAQVAGDGAQLMTGSSLAGHAVGAVADTLASSFGSHSNNSTQTDLSALGASSDASSATTQLANTSSAATQNLNINAPVGSSGFADELGQQITWLSGQDVKQATIKLNPENLGPLDVKVSVEHGRVDVAFLTQHPATAAVVQDSLGQLHAMLGSQGLELGQTSVGQQQQQYASGQQGQGGSSSSSSGSNEVEDAIENVASTVATTSGLGLVDAFA